jgi:hypothetical protein
MEIGEGKKKKHKVKNKNENSNITKEDFFLKWRTIK